MEWEPVIAACGSALLEDGVVRIHTGPGRSVEELLTLSSAIAQWCGLDEIDITQDGPSHIILTQADERKWAAQWN